MTMLCRAVRSFVLVSAFWTAGVAAAAERALSPPPHGPAFSAQLPVLMGFHADEGIVIWNDYRSGSASPRQYLGRIDASGVLLESGPSPFGGSIHALVPVANGWVVIFSASPNLYGQRMSRTGELAGPPVLLMERPGGSISVASNGRTIFIVNSTTTGHLAVVANVDLSGVEFVDTNRMIPRSVVTDGNEYVVFGQLPWPHSQETVHAARYSGNGEWIEQKDTGFRVGSAVWTGRDYLVAGGSKPGTISRLNSDLTPIAEIELTGERVFFLSLTGNGDGTALVTWAAESSGEQSFSTYAALAGPDGLSSPIVIDGGQRLGSDYPPFVLTARTSAGYVFATTGLRALAVDRNLAGVQAAMLSLLPEQTRSPAAQARFSADRSGNSDLYVFMEQDGVTSRVLIGRHGFAGRRLIDTGFAQYSPSIASSGNTTLVTWIEDRRSGLNPYTLVAALVDRSGGLLSEEPLILGDIYHRPDSYWTESDQLVWPAAVVWSGSMFLVARGALMSRVLETGVLLDVEPRRVLDEEFNDHLSMARLGDVVVATWMTSGVFRGCAGQSCTYAGIHAARFTTNGDLIDAQPIELLPRQGWGLPQIAANGDVALIVAEWNEAFLMRADGSYVRFHYTTQLGIRATVARHGDGFLISWQNPRNRGEILARSVSRDLELSETWLVTSDSSATQGPQAWTAVNGLAGIAYVRVGPHTEWVPRLYTRTIAAQGRARSRAVGR